jgi:parallel beta-helix repeat protein
MRKNLPSTRPLRMEPLEDRRMLSRTLLVDDDRNLYRNAQFTSIQAAVNAASPGDLILVGPGTYTESVTVNKRLIIQGTFAAGKLVNNPRFASIVDPPASVVETPGFNFQANKITVQGFTIADLNGDAAANGTIGIYTSPTFSSYKIVGNEIKQNSIGIYLHSSGVGTSLVTANRIHDNNRGLGVLPAAGNAIYSDQGAQKITINSNIIRNQGNAAILFTGLIGEVPFATPNNRLNILANVIGDANRDDSGAAILLIDVTNSSVKANALFNSNGSAIALAGGCSNITVQANTIRGAEFTGVNLANIIDLVTPNTNNSILSNTIINVGAGGGSGIRIRGDASGNLVRGNVITGSQQFDSTPGYGNGITLEDTAHDNRVELNSISKNARDGIFADIGTSDNRLNRNVAVLDGRFDFEDLSIGLGTAGTANFWTNNVGQTASPSGLKV